ncbi:hypothetical protein FH972_003344 [Carpinus fangiana]|uniref:RanBP2-type domain-containing protein n=1 Tax=Carpinus fangiana TaxID=176857 RepID=A0A5N6QHN3_9ROSI|nr:hypothetical protein FH972_003344 [Carpinus fangiana]
MSWSGGDWMCGACQHLNFKKRDACQHCGYPKYGGPDPSTYVLTRPGDWHCTAMNCGAHNYASRSSCYRCGAYKNDYSAMTASADYGTDASVPPGWKSVMGVECTIMLAGRNVSNARNQGIMVVQFNQQEF